MQTVRKHPESVLFWVIFAAAVAARVWNIAGIPDGFHGDEAWTGLDARRILAEGWIGPYVPGGLGQPSGPIYLVAALFLWLPDDIATIRLAIATIGSLGVAVTYLLAREYEGRSLALCAAALLGGSLWHLHASRMGMMFVSASTMLMAGLWLQAVALRRCSLGYSIAAGLVAGLGVYSYNAYPLALPLYAIPLLHAVVSVDPAARRQTYRLGAVFAVAAVIAAAPMVVFAVGDPGGFFGHHQRVSVLSSDRWMSGGWSTRMSMLGDRAWYWIEGLFVRGNFDSGDGYGAGGIPIIDRITGALAAAGLVLALIRRRQCLSILMLTAVPLLALGAILTAGPGAYRRTTTLSPFVAMLAATSLVACYRVGVSLSERYGSKLPRIAALVSITGLIATSAWINLSTYFGPFIHDHQMNFVFAPELTRAARYLAGVQHGTRVYFFSERWSCDYESRRFLAPDLECVDRSRRFRKQHTRSGVLDFKTNRDRPAAIFLMGEHLRHLDRLLRSNPAASAVTEDFAGQRVFAAVSLPEGVAQHFGLPAAEKDNGGPIVSIANLEPLDLRYDFEPPQVDRTWNGHPLRLGGRNFARGLGMHAPTEIVYPVPTGATKLITTVGLSEHVDKCAKASVVFEVIDSRGVVLASSGIMRPGDPVQVLRAEVSDMRRVVLMAGDAGDGRDCDHANWGNPRFVRPRTAVPPTGPDRSTDLAPRG